MKYDLYEIKNTGIQILFNCGLYEDTVEYKYNLNMAWMKHWNTNIIQVRPV